MPVNDVVLAAQGDTAAFERVYHAHLPRVFNLARRMAGPDAAEELTQDVVFLQLLHQRLVADLQRLGGSLLVAGGVAEALFQLAPFDLRRHVRRRASVIVPDKSMSSQGEARRRDNRLAERQVQVARLDGVGVAENHRALDAVLQLADVARPGVGVQLVERAGDSVNGFLFRSRQNLSTKWRARMTTSFDRSRSGGI